MASFIDIHPGPAGAGCAVLRAAPVFTPMEYARIQALMRLSGPLLLPDGTELLVRRARVNDAGAVRDMHARCSPSTRQRRYFSGLLCPPDAKLRRLLEPPGGITALAVHFDPRSGAERVVAMANLRAEGALGEVAVLVEDDWQRQGIGTDLLRGLSAYAERTGFAALIAYTSADNVPMLRTLRRLGYGSPDRDGTVISLTLPMPGRPA